MVALLARAALWRVNRDNSLQWLTVGVVGVAVGLYVLLVSSVRDDRWASLFIVAALCPFIALIVRDVRRTLLAIVMLDIPLQVEINLFYRPDTALLGAVEGLKVSLTTLALAGLYVIWLSDLLAKREAVAPPTFRWSLPLVLFVTISCLSAVVARDLELSVFGIFLLVQMLLLYVYIASTIRTRGDVLFLVTMLLLGLLGESLIILGTAFLGHGGALGAIKARVDTDTLPSNLFSRIGGTIGAPNNTGAYLSLLLAVSIGAMVTQVGNRVKWLAVLAFGLGAAALILTLSRGAWISFALACTFLCVLAWRRGWLSPAIPLAFAILVALVAVVFQGAILTRFFASDQGSAASRIYLMELAFRVIQANPILGVGANNYAFVFKDFVTPDFGGLWLYTVHNKYLVVLSETGIGGLIVFVWFLFETLQRGWQCWQAKDRFLSPIALGFVAGILGLIFHMLVDVFAGRPLTELLWFSAGLVTAMSNMEKA